MKRWPLFVAIGYVVVAAAGLFIVPTAPEANADGFALRRFYQQHDVGVRALTWLATIAVLFLVPLVAVLRSRLSGLGRDVSFVGAIGVVAMTMVWTWFSAGLALHPYYVDAFAARSIADVSLYYGPTLTVLVILFVAPIGLAAWRGHGGLPRWLAWATAVLVVEQLIETITIFGSSGFIAPGGAMNLQLGVGLYLVWIVCAGAAVTGALTKSE